MGKAIATPKSNKRGPIIVKFWYNDVEPPKNYVWVRDDFYYIYQNHNWVPYEYEDLLFQLPVGCIYEKVPMNSCNMQCSCIKYVTPADLTDRLEKFQKELLAKIVKLINTSTSGDVSVLDKYVKEQLEPRIEQLENNESNYLTSDALNEYATKEFVNNAIEAIDIPTSEVYDDSELRGRVESLEEASNNYATTKMIPTLISQLDNDSGYISGIELTEDPDITTINNGDTISAITDIEMDKVESGAYHLYGSISKFRINVPISETYDDSELRQKIENNELVTSSLLNDLDSRIDTIESSEYATQNWVENKHYLTEHQPLNGYATEQYVDNKVSDLINSAPAALDTLNELATALNNDANFATTVTNQLANKADKSEIPTLTSQLTNDSGFISENEEYVTAAALNNLNDRVTELENGGYDDSALLNRVTALEETISELSDVATTGSYNDLVDTPIIPKVPTNVSAFTNDAGYLTSHQSLNDYSTTAQMNTAIATATNDIATQTWVENNYEPKFTDLTNETDPEAVAQTHTSDNKVYITEVIEPEQGGE